MARQRDPDRYALLGHPVVHSWSPFIHGLFAQQFSHDIQYKLLDVPPDRFRKAVIDFFVDGGRGLNITVPHKQAAAELVNELTPRADRARAVNTIFVPDRTTLVGDNTDGVGLVKDLLSNLQLGLADKRILILGAGGAVRGVLAPLLGERPALLHVANRTPERAVELVRDFSDLGPITSSSFDAVPPSAWDLVVNATSASLSGEVPGLPAGVLTPETICYDMAYGHGDTAFQRWAKSQGVTHAYKGWGMLVEQAAESYLLWRGVRPDPRPVLEALAHL
jgi:shikimate dehydrogenase